MEKWNKATEWEASWWGTCQNTLGEELKQLLYIEKMGLELFHNGKSPFNIDMNRKTVVDIGGGPCSILLKCSNVNGIVIDPCEYPDWIYERYRLANIVVYKAQAEEIKQPKSDEVWMYNVLQHVRDPEVVITNALSNAKIIRLFEWIDTEINEGHLHCLTEDNLNKWLGGEGKVEWVDKHTARGKAYFGIFKGKDYEKV